MGSLFLAEVGALRRVMEDVVERLQILQEACEDSENTEPADIAGEAIDGAEAVMDALEELQQWYLSAN